MQSYSQSSTVSASDVAALPPEKVAKRLNDLTTEIGALRHQLEWFKRQIFGEKSERRLEIPDASQPYLGEEFATKPDRKEAKKTHIKAHDRVTKPKEADDDD